MAKQYWLMKCEASVYSISDLARDKTTSWEGVRNYQARNFMRDDMRVGDAAIYYHSNADPSGAAGVMTIARAGYPDDFAHKKGHKYFDAKSSPDEPRWFMVDVEFVEQFPEVVSLADMKANPRLDGMPALQKGQRLSVMPISKKHFDEVVKMGRD